MTYEYSGMGFLVGGGSVADRTGTTSSGSQTGTPVFKVFIPPMVSQKGSTTTGTNTLTPPVSQAQITTGSIPPSGMVEVPVNMRADLMAWADKALYTPTQKTILAAFKKLSPPCWYFPAKSYADYLNAKEVCKKLWATRYHPDQKAIGDANKALARETSKKFLAWWKKCHPTTWARWEMMTNGTFTTKGMVPEKFYFYAKNAFVNKAGAPCPSSAVLTTQVGDTFLRQNGIVPITEKKLLDDQKVKNASTIISGDKKETDAAKKAAADAQKIADEKQQEVNELKGTVDTLQQRIDEVLEQLAAASQPSGAPAASDDAVASLTTLVASLQAQLQQTNEQLAHTQQEADEAAEIAEDAQEEVEESFMSRYKWHFAIGGFAAVAAGLWYFYMYKPKQTTGIE